jgi:glycosyltransferase involved in cell wall biosynthesis
MPCLNEEKSIGVCIDKAKTALVKLHQQGYRTEIIISDNGSTDRSLKVVRKKRVRIVKEPHKGYGAALMKGIRSAKGNFIIMGDCDGTYDFSQIPRFIKELESGVDLVLGSRIKGKIHTKSMPFLHRYLGTPILTKMINIFYGCNLSDSQTGYRAFTKEAFVKMRLKSQGMEFASEMLIKAIGQRLNMSEIPINYFRRQGISKLSPIKDASRHLLSIMIYSPTYAFILPGLLLLFFGTLGTIILLPGPYWIGKILMLDIHTMIASVFAAVLGTHIILTGIFARLYTTYSLNISGGLISRFILKYANLKNLLLIGLVLFFVALGIIGEIVYTWITSGFKELAKEREFILALGFGIVGIQIISSTFLFSLIENNKIN